MSATTFNKLAYVGKLKAGGFTEEQARTQADALEGALGESVVTDGKLDARLKELELRLIKWLIPLLLGQAALVAALVKLL